MKKLFTYFTPPLLFLLVIVSFSCQKVDMQNGKIGAGLQSVTSFTGSISNLTSADFIPQDGDSIERITVLGAKLTNPYLIPNMQQAYSNLGLSPSLAVVNNLYVRFFPSGSAQLYQLDSSMDAQNL
jgi:hypothetical protein